MLAAWRGLGGLLAVGAGAGTAFVSWFRGVALDVACLRGGLTLVAALVVTRICGALLTRASLAKTSVQEGTSVGQQETR